MNTSSWAHDGSTRHRGIGGVGQAEFRRARLDQGEDVIIDFGGGKVDPDPWVMTPKCPHQVGNRIGSECRQPDQAQRSSQD